jgi:hypothetical protein
MERHPYFYGVAYDFYINNHSNREYFYGKKQLGPNAMPS